MGRGPTAERSTISAGPVRGVGKSSGCSAAAPSGIGGVSSTPMHEKRRLAQNSQQFRLDLYGELVSLRAAPPQHPAGLTACHWHRHVERGDWPQNSQQFRLGLYGGLVSLRAAPPKHPAELHVSFDGTAMWTIPRYLITRPSQPYRRVTQGWSACPGGATTTRATTSR